MFSAISKISKYSPPLWLLLMFDIIALVALTLYALWTIIFSVFAEPLYAAPVITLLLHIAAVGTIVYLSASYGTGGRIVAGGIFLFFLFIQLALIFGILSLSDSSSINIVGAQIVTVSAWILFVVGLIKKQFGSHVFRILAIANTIFCFIFFILLFINNPPFSLTARWNIVSTTALLFSVPYIIYRLYHRYARLRLQSIHT